MCLSLGSIRATVDSEPVEMSSEPLIRYPSNIVDTIDWRLCSREFQVRSAETFWNQRMSGSWRERDDPENRACEISLARLSPRLLRRRESKRHLFFVVKLGYDRLRCDIYLWWILWITSPEPRCRCRTRGSSFALLPASAKGEGGLFCICVESINLT